MSGSTVEKIGAGFIAAAGIAALVPVIIALSTMVGAGVGWFAGVFYPRTFDAWLTVLGLEMQPYQVGAMLGFVSAFFRRPAASSKSET